MSRFRNRKPQTRHGDDRLAAVEDVGRVVGQVKVTRQVRPIPLDGLQRRVAVHAGNVVHDEETAADYVLITSWNGWHEGSELEASVEYGSRILDDTAAFSRQFLAQHK